VRICRNSFILNLETPWQRQHTGNSNNNILLANLSGNLFCRSQPTWSAPSSLCLHGAGLHWHQHLVKQCASAVSSLRADSTVIGLAMPQPQSIRSVDSVSSARNRCPPRLHIARVTY
jgi:hypothetical protein